MYVWLKMEELANDRLEAIGQANLEAEAAGAKSLREEADRLVTEHRERTAELQEAMEVRADAWRCRDVAGADTHAKYCYKLLFDVPVLVTRRFGLDRAEQQCRRIQTGVAPCRSTTHIYGEMR